MVKYIIKRVLYMFVVLIILSVLMFVLYRFCKFLFIVVHILYNVKYEKSNRRKFKTIAHERTLDATTSCECVAHIESELHKI